MRASLIVSSAALAVSASAMGQTFCPRADHRCVLRGGDGGPYVGLTSVSDWYATYCPDSTHCHVDGIFFDVGPSLGSSIPEADQRAYYHSLYQAVTTWPGAVGPCGTAPNTHPCVMINAAQFPNDWVMSTSPSSQIADYVITYERPVHGSKAALCPGGKADSQNYIDDTTVTPTAPAKFCPSGTTPSSCAAAQTPSNWYFDSANTPREVHTLFSAVASDVSAIVAKSRATAPSGYGSPGFLYIHDQDCGPKGAQYGHVSKFFEHAVAAAQPSQSLAVAAMFPLSTKDNLLDYDWTRIKRAGSAAKIVVAAYDNLAPYVPGDACLDSPTHAFDCLHPNQWILGYVYTDSAQRDLGVYPSTQFILVTDPTTGKKIPLVFSF